MMDTLYERYPVLLPEKEHIEAVIELLCSIFENGSNLYLCGNGGSAADCDHIVGELMKGFLLKRPVNQALRRKFVELGEPAIAACLQEGLPAISLTGGGALPTAYANDMNPEYIFAQQVMGLGRAGDILLGISTSGNARNVRNAMVVAKAKGMHTVGLTGKTGGWLAENADIAICVPEGETYKIQELHLPVYHWICASVERHFFEETVE